MDIHKPKAAHNWREFLIEIGTIVCGILIALGLEQVAETLHERRLSAEAREAVRSEINLDLASLHQRDEWEPCIQARFAQLDAVFAAADAGRPFQPVAYIGRPNGVQIYSQRWEAATSGGRTSLLSSDEQLDFARVYAGLKILEERQQEESSAWGRLRALETVTHPSAETLARAREALSEARQIDYVIRRVMLNSRTYAARIGIQGDAKIVSVNRRMASICLPTSTRRADVGTLTKDAVGDP